MPGLCLVSGADPIGEAPQHLHEDVALLGTGHHPALTMRPGEHEGGDCGDLTVASDLEPLPNLGRSIIAVEKRERSVSVETHIGSTVGEHVGVADVETVFEVGAEQTFLQGRLMAGRLGEHQESMGQQGVGPQGAIHVELDAFGGGDRGDVTDDLLSSFRAPELLCVRLRHRGCRPGRCRWVELIRAIHGSHLDVVARGLQFRQGLFETSLADVAPRTDDIGPDLDLEHGRHRSQTTARIVPEVSAADRARVHADVQATFCATLVDQWARDGVTHAMVAPGSRSTPMALAIAACRDLHVEVFHDERSAAFAALGAGLASRRPALLLCTSGTASTHFHGAVVEAHLSDVPMLVLTADRPPELHDVGAPQTIDQTKLFGDAVRWFHDPGVPTIDTSHTWRALARHAQSRTLGTRSGPVHLNLPFREPLVGDVGELPAAHLGPLLVEQPSVKLGTLAMQLDRERGIIVAGRGVDDPAAVAALSEATGWPVLADPRSACRGLTSAVTAFDSLLRHEGFAASHLPEVVVHLGEPPASKVLSTWLAGSGAVQVRVTTTDTWSDPVHAVAHRVLSPIGDFCRRLAKELRGAGGSDWVQRWTHVTAIADRALAAELDTAAELTEPLVARVMSRLDGHVVVASSMPVRDLEWFGAPDQQATVWSNRGANGIDGTVATAIGVASVSGRAVTVLLGDVALLHDASSLTALVRRSVEVRIVVVDNDGGGIFSFLPQAAALAEERFEQLFGTPHGTDLVGLAAAHGLRASTVATRTELEARLAEPGSQLIRVASERSANVDEHARLHAAVTAAMRPD